MAAFPRKRLGWRLQLGILAALVSATAESVCLAKMCQKFMTEWRSVLLRLLRESKGSWCLDVSCLKDGDILVTYWWHPTFDVTLVTEIQPPRDVFFSVRRASSHLLPGSNVTHTSWWKRATVYNLVRLTDWNSTTTSSTDYKNSLKFIKLLQIN